ncbi:MAG: septum formation initiator [Campylobacteraceae bacterium]
MNKYTKQNIIFTAKVSLIFFVVVLFGIYVGNILFGTNSLEVLNDRKTDKAKLENVILALKKENAALQKEYFELRQLDPDMRRK